MSFETDSQVGSSAIAIFARKIAAVSNVELRTVEGSMLDKQEGIDYQLFSKQGTKLQDGAHRHITNRYKGKAMLRYSRMTGAPTDFHKLFNKPDNFLYSFSFGALDEKMEVVTTTARSIKEWIAKTGDLSSHVVWPFGPKDNSFLQIPFEELYYTKTI